MSFSFEVSFGSDMTVRGENAGEGMLHGKISLSMNDDENAVAGRI